MYLNDIGKFVNKCWSEIPNHFQFIELGEFVIMPNHVHGIIINFGWQSRFYDHIIRNQIGYLRISNYIINNPKNWKKDKFFND